MSFEFQSQDKVSFADIIPNLNEGEGLILSRTEVTSVLPSYRYQDQPVHYAGLDDYLKVNSESNGATDIYTEFIEAASGSNLLSNPETTAHYPRLQVVHDATYNAAEEIIDVARLVQQGRLPIYSSNARSTRGGKIFTVGMKSLIYDLARDVGVDPARSVVIEGGGAATLDEVGFEIQQTVGQEAEFQDFEDTRGQVPTREDLLMLLQMEVMKQFKERSPRAVRGPETRPMVILSLTEIPDIKFLVSSMINAVEQRRLKLVLERDSVDTGVQGYVFSVAGDNVFASPKLLSAERSFGMAAYNGFLAVESTIRNM